MTFTAAGRLIHPITIEAVTGTEQTATGEALPVWSQVAQVWGEIKPLTGRNVEIAMAKTKARTLSHLITIRHPDIPVEVAKNRISYHGRYFEIFAVDNIFERNIELQITANEVKS